MKKKDNEEKEKTILSISLSLSLSLSLVQVDRQQHPRQAQLPHGQALRQRAPHKPPRVRPLVQELADERQRRRRL